MDKIKLPAEVFISLYAALADRRLQAFEFAEYSNDGDPIYMADNGGEGYSEWAQDEFNDETNVICGILADHGIEQEAG